MSFDEQPADAPMLTPIVPPTWRQLGILVLDGSGTMKSHTRELITKAESVQLAVRDLIQVLQNSRKASNFSLAIVTFDVTARVHTPPTPVANMEAFVPYDPLDGHGGQTDFSIGLMAAKQLAEQFLSEPDTVPRSVVVVFMSDGMNNHGDPTEAIAALKSTERLTICTTYFQGADSNDGTDQILRGMASSPRNYATTYRAQDLREFFKASVSIEPGGRG